MKDQEIFCVQCKNIFIVTDGEKRRLLARGFDIQKRCPECRKKKSKMGIGNENRKGGDKRKHERKRYEIDFE